MINWDEMPGWADRVVVGPTTGGFYWANLFKRYDIEWGVLDDNNEHIDEKWETKWPPSAQLDSNTTEEHTGLSVDYYRVEVTNPTSASEPYTAECNDIIEALGMNYAEGNVFKANWRRAAERTLGKRKKGNNSRYDAEKMVFFSDRILKQEDNE